MRQALSLGRAAALLLALPGTAFAQDAPAAPTPAAGARTLTLADVVALAVDHNSTAVLARLRLKKAQELIRQVDAQTRPQVRASVVDTYSSQAGFSTVPVSAANPTLPGGGQIPTITDQGGGSTGTFIGGGGGGTAPSNGGESNGVGGTTTAPSSGGPNTTTAPATVAPSTGGTSTGGTATGTGSAGSLHTANVTLGELPPVVRQYAAQSQPTSSPAPTATAKTAAPRADGSGGSGGNGSAANGTTGFSGGNTGKHNNYSGQIALTQYIDLFGLAKSARDVERLTESFYTIDLDRVSNEVAYSAKTSFFNVLKDQANVAVYQEQVAADTENVRIAQAKFAAGASPQYDVLTAQVTLANAQQQLTSAQNTLSLDQANLNNLLGIDPNAPVVLQPPALPPTDQAIDLKANTEAAYGRRPELKQADQNIEIAKKLLKLSSSSVTPVFAVGANANYAGNTAGSNPHDTYSVSAEISVPLFDGGTARSQRRQAETDLQTQLTTRDQLRQNVSLEVRQAYLNIQTAQAQVGTTGTAVTQAQEAARIARLRYQNGLGTFLDVTNAEAQLAQARTNLANAQFSYQTSLAQLVRAVGGR